MSFPTYTPTKADAKAYASKIIYGKQVKDYNGTDLDTPDTYKQLAHLGDFTLPESWSKETGKYWQGEDYLLNMTKEATANMKLISRDVAVLQDYKEAVEGNIYKFLVELTDQPLNGNYQILTFMGELIKPPQIGKSPELDFEWYVGYATAATSENLYTIQNGGGLQNLSFELPITVSIITQAIKQPFGILQLPWE